MPIQTIGEADAFFASLPDGPDAVQDFAAALPPAGAAAYIPVAGTAGKTAVASLTAGILAAAGFRTGLYRAGAGPLSERITLQGRSLGEDPAGPAAAAYLAAAGNILENTLLNRPAAELAAACACLEAAGCQVAVVEVGDGALASALPAAPACAVTHIGPDGSGRSIERLAHDAAAVMREGTVCVTAPGQPKAALTEIIVAAGKAGCELVVPEEEDITFPEEEDARVDYGGYDVPPAFPGYHAACNAAIAVELALALWRKGWDIPDEAILSALAGAENRSSIRILSQKPLVILDACRTPSRRRRCCVCCRRPRCAICAPWPAWKAARGRRNSLPLWKRACCRTAPRRTGPGCPAWGRPGPSTGCSSPCRREETRPWPGNWRTPPASTLRRRSAPACPRRWRRPVPQGAAGS